MTRPQLEKVERTLMDLLREVEEANGPHQATKLENLIRFAWDEARAERHRQEAHV